MLIDVAISKERNVIKKEAEKILKHKRPHNRNSAHVECKNKGDTSNNRGECHVKEHLLKRSPGKQSQA